MIFTTETHPQPPFEPRENFLLPPSQQRYLIHTSKSVRNIPLPPVRPLPKRPANPNTILFALILLLFAIILSPAHTSGYGFNSVNQCIVHYPGSLIISHHSKATIFYSDNHCQCQSRLRSRYLWPRSAPYKQLFESTTESTQAIKQVINHLVSIQGQTNLIEWDSYLRRFYRYATGLTSTMICPHPYQSSLKECKSYAINHCSGILHHQRTCLKSPLRRSSWFCHDGVFGLYHAIYEYIGHSCEEKPCFPFEKHNMGCV